MKGYKAFSKGLFCNGKQYAENTVFEEEGAKKCCSKGVMHFCETPLDTLDYYPLVSDDGELTEWAEVEALDDVLTNGNKRATKRLRIGRKLNFEEFVSASVKTLIEKTTVDVTDSQLASSGDNSNLTSSGDCSKLASSGDCSKLASSGNNSNLASSGNFSQLTSSGYDSKLASSGNFSNLTSSGNCSKLASSGDNSKLASSGNNSIVANIGVNSIAKATIGSWIVLAEWKACAPGKVVPVNVKVAQVDGETIKENVFYRLVDGEFKETNP